MAREQTWIRKASGARGWLKERQTAALAILLLAVPPAAGTQCVASSAGMLNMQARQPVPTTLDGTRSPKAGRGAYCAPVGRRKPGGRLSARLTYSADQPATRGGRGRAGS